MSALTQARRLAPGLVLGLLLTACGGATTSESVAFPSPSPSSDVSDESGASGDAAPPLATDPTDVGYEETPIVPTQGTPRPIPFESAEASADGTEVVVRWWSGVPPCTALADVVVTEDDTTITITLLEASEHADGAEVACIEIAQAKQHTIQLATPVGGRAIVDGAT